MTAKVTAYLARLPGVPRMYYPVGICGPGNTLAELAFTADHPGETFILTMRHFVKWDPSIERMGAPLAGLGITESCTIVLNRLRPGGFPMELDGLDFTLKFTINDTRLADARIIIHTFEETDRVSREITYMKKTLPRTLAAIVMGYVGSM
jgi:hypothetical protein